VAYLAKPAGESGGMDRICDTGVGGDEGIAEICKPVVGIAGVGPGGSR
jgi:hypothetical protein